MTKALQEGTPLANNTDRLAELIRDLQAKQHYLNALLDAQASAHEEGFHVARDTIAPLVDQARKAVDEILGKMHALRA